MTLELREPWIGDRFEGLLVVGEGHYGDADDLTLTKQVIEEAVDPGSPHPFFAKIEMVVTGENSGRRGEASFWHRVAFANYCPGAVDGPRMRPTADMWEAAYRLFPDLLEIVRPRRILVLGNATWDNIGAIRDTVLIDVMGRKREAARLTHESGPYGDGIPITSIRHPSSFGFRTMLWNQYYYDFVNALPDTDA